MQTSILTVATLVVLDTKQTSSTLSDERVFFIYLLGSTENTFHLVGAVVLGEDTQKRAQLQPPVLLGNAVTASGGDMHFVV